MLFGMKLLLFTRDPEQSNFSGPRMESRLTLGLLLGLAAPAQLQI